MEQTFQQSELKLKIEDLQKSTKTALLMDEINIAVHAGEIFALVGGPESCKTLLSKIVVKLVKKTKGEVRLDGKFGASLHQQNFYKNLTAYKTIEQYAKLQKHPVSRSRIVNVLSLVDLKKVMHQTLDRFDAGAIARLRIAIAIFTSPKILILDDPFRNMTREQAHKIRVIIKTIAEVKGTAVFITTQNAADVEEICDTIGIIDDGFIVTIKSYNQFIRDDAPYETMRVQTPTPNYTAQIIEETLKYNTHLCGEWVVVDTPPTNAQAIADALTARGVKVLSVQRVNRSLSEQFYEVISSRRNRRAALPGGVPC